MRLVFGQRGEPLPGEVPQLKGRVASWFSGPEQACQTTAARLGGRAEVIPELRDCDFGEWTGSSLGHVAADDPSGLDAWLRDPSVAPHGGESLADMITRVAYALGRLSVAGGSQRRGGDLTGRKGTHRARAERQPRGDLSHRHWTPRPSVAVPQS